MTNTILIVEDHPLYRGALIHLVGAIVGASNTVAVSSAEEGLRLAHTLDTLRIVLLDLGLPGIKGIDAITAFQRACPAAAIIVVSASDDRQEANRVLKNGACVFISKAASTEVLDDCVRRVLSGALIAPEWITSAGLSIVGGDSSLKLTQRQQETLFLLSQGHSNKEIAIRLNLSEISIKVHVSAIFRLLGVVNRTQAVSAARQLGLEFEFEKPNFLDVK
jgi:DNA-binding NarL/FixJ family response regulator